MPSSPETQLSALRDRVRELDTIIRGDPNLFVAGLVERLRALEERIAEQEQLTGRVTELEERHEKRQRSRTRAIGWGVTLVITMIGALLWPLIQFLTG